MLFRSLLLSAVAAFAAGLSSQASAAVTTFVLTGVGSGSVTQQDPLGSPMAFQDVALEFDVISSAVAEVDSADVKALGQTATLDPTQWVVGGTPSLGEEGFGFLSGGLVFLNVEFNGPGLVGISRAVDLPPTPVTINLFGPFDFTFQGATYGVTLTSFTDAEFSLTTVGSPAPEPASWALLLAGFGGAGLLLRRRRAIPA